MQFFKYQLPLILGLVLTIVISIGFPAHAVLATAIPDPMPIFGMTVLQFLTWLVSSAVLGVIVVYVLSYFHVPANQATLWSTIIVAVVNAAVTAALQFVPPWVLNMTVWQGILAVLSFLLGLGGIRIAVMLHASQMAMVVMAKADAKELGL